VFLLLEGLSHLVAEQAAQVGDAVNELGEAPWGLRLPPQERLEDAREPRAVRGQLRATGADVALEIDDLPVPEALGLTGRTFTQVRGRHLTIPVRFGGLVRRLRF